MNDRDLMMRGLDEALSPSEAAALERLLEGDAEARVAWQEHLAVAHLVAEETADAFKPYFADRVMRRVRGSEAWRPAWRERLEGWLAPSPVRLAFAAAVVLVVAFTSIWWWRQPVTVAAGYGTTHEVTLEDGTIVQLNSGSRLTYDRTFGDALRAVRLDGEAFFDVTKSAVPFEVQTVNARIRVLGTRFNVRAWADDEMPETTVALEAGRVSLLPLPPAPHAATMRALAAPVVLAPGQSARVTGDSTSAPFDASLAHATAWRTGGLAFVDQPPRAIFRALEHHYGVAIDLHAALPTTRTQSYLNPHPASLDDVLSDLCHSLGLRYRRTARGYEILPGDE